MFISSPRSAIALYLLVTLLSGPAVAAAEPVPEADQQTQPADKAPTTGQKVATAEEPAKPTRSFFPALFHNLGDDVKHIPRMNSLYWLAAGAGLALVVHPEDNKINRRLRGSDF